MSVVAPIARLAWVTMATLVLAGMAGAHGRVRAAALGPAGDAGATAHVDRASVPVVDPVTLTIELRAPAGWGSPEPSPRPSAGEPLGDFIISSVRRDPPAASGERVVHRWVVLLEPQLPGDAVIPSFEFTADAARGVAVRTEPIAVRITSVLEHAEGFVPGVIRPPLGPPTTAERGRGLLVWAALGVLLLVGAGAGLIASRPTPLRRIRRSFATLRDRAAALAGRGDGGSPAARALSAREVIRQGAALAVGPSALGATAGEFAERVARVVPDMPDAGTVTALLEWSERALHDGERQDPPALPDVAAVLASFERAASGAARRARRGRRGA